MTAIRLAFLELRRFRGHPIRYAALAVVVLMPLLYAGLYLWSAWDPYGSLDRVPVAVVNEDEGAEMDGKKLHAGNELVKQLKETPYLDWNFVSADEAERGMSEGDYYFTIAVPEDFSKNLSTLSGLDPERAHVLVELDDANGYIVGIMAKTVEAELQNQINTAVYVTFAKTMFGNLTELDEGIKKAADGADKIADGAYTADEGAQELATGLGKLETGSEQVADGVGTVNDAVQGNKDTLIGSLDTIKTGAQIGTDITDDLAGVDEAELAEICQDGGPVCDAVTQAVQKAKQDQSKVDSLNDVVQNLSGDKISQDAQQMQDLADGADEVADGIAQAQKGANDLAEGTAKLSKGAGELSDQLSLASDKIPSADPEQNAKAADVLGSPVSIKEENANPAKTYGRGLAPFFFGIALWVFGLVAFLVLRTVNPRALAGSVGAFSTALAGWFPALLLGILGSLALYVVADVGLGLDPINIGGTIGLCVLAIAVFSAMAHLLRLAFGAAGGVLVLVLLMVQLTSSGGLYPLQTTPGFFQVLHPCLPMSYLVDGLRVTISGGNVDHLWRDVWVLAAFGVGTVALSTLVTMWQRRWSISTLHPSLTI
ncbi:YhgE/Pip family protein [Stackebrandtia nassauensis]|uniref:YhgE/Pip N-terminal domain protein n=1 Tax=Stackebrandtia nassauensis (strain DSM 44728 / CIP 108903 / NRRL B-16338 / NBRC 102104 / LLR-40K-21) TaxID=446470 RepID=D3Q1E8_STANL|nr:YhgE/Pip domain-containing protein [Stackebrandtia nassauensis]ADD45728.1 YhgE/Pip N-terminal domain protein [Stackebrandtia nassauensis DSM 44728]